jgi:CheY-like chemotaxis protein
MAIKTIRICYFEDDVQHREVVGRHLVSEGYIVDLCSDGASAIKAAQENTPDIILADILMPGMNGLATIKELRENGIKAPIIVLTNYEKNDLDAADLKDMHITKILLKASTSLDDITREIAQVSAQSSTRSDNEPSL